MNEEMNMTAKITLKDGTVKTYKKGTSYLDVAKDSYFDDYKNFVGVKVNNNFAELHDVVKEDVNVEFFDVTTKDGNKYYVRALKLLLYRAVRDLYGKNSVTMNQSINKGIYCEIDGIKITDGELKKITKRMEEVIEADEPIERETYRKADAIKKLEASGLHKKAKLFKYKSASNINLYKLGWVYDYMFGFMVPSTGYLKLFRLTKEGNGFVLKYPDVYNSNDMPKDIEQKKLFNVFSETDEWAKILGIQTVGDLNEMISKGKSKEIVLVSEAMQEKKIANIVDKVISKQTVKMVLIAGPSSSGKTTFANRLAIQLKAAGKTPLVISLDNYYKERGDNSYPLGPDGKPDWESLYALEIDLFNQNMTDLLEGKEVNLPTYDFTTGKRVPGKSSIKLEENTIMIIEGIHGLNEELTHKISKDKKFKVYVSALTPLSLDEHNRISTTDNRLLRRIVRDSKFRAYPALRTLEVWDSVRLGEEKNIFPYQEEADVMFNTALVYELPILKHYAEPMLYGVPQDSPYYSEAKRLIKFLSYILGLDSEAVPPNSLLREFIGGSCFY